jgi:ADP-L-glycero-D-manno-heptose 6-epimerase
LTESGPGLSFFGMILITGAAGLIGSAVARELNRRGRNNLLLVDHLGTSEKWMNLRSLRYSHYIEKDALLTALQTGSQSLFGINVIFHLGACSSTTEKDASYLVQNNYQFSIRLAEFAQYKGIRMVYASSAATYGEGENGFEDGLAKLDTLRPLNMYGYSKHMFDLWLRDRQFDPHFVGMKYFNVFGPNEYHKGEMMSLVLKAYRQIQQEGKMRLFKSYRPEYRDGEQMRDFYYVEDAARLTVALGLDSHATGLFNAGSGQANTWLSLAEAIFAAMGRSPEIEFVEMPDHLKEKYQYYTCAPMDSIRAAGIQAPVTPLADAVRDYVQNYLMKGERRA